MSMHSPFRPYLQGRTVLAIKYDKGVLIAADTLLESLNGKTNCDNKRILKINEIIILGGSGDSADLKYIVDQIGEMKSEHYCDGITLTPRMLFSWLTKKLYLHYTNGKPLYIDVIVGGLEDGKPFLANIRHDGNAFEDDPYTACDFGSSIGHGNVSYKNLVWEYIGTEIKNLSSCSEKDETSYLIRKPEALRILIGAIQYMNTRFKHSIETYILGECEIDADNNSKTVIYKPNS